MIIFAQKNAHRYLNPDARSTRSTQKDLGVELMIPQSLVADESDTLELHLKERRLAALNRRVAAGDDVKVDQALCDLEVSALRTHANAKRNGWFVK